MESVKIIRISSKKPPHISVGRFLFFVLSYGSGFVGDASINRAMPIFEEAREGAYVAP